MTIDIKLKLSDFLKDRINLMNQLKPQRIHGLADHVNSLKYDKKIETYKEILDLIDKVSFYPTDNEEKMAVSNAAPASNGLTNKEPLSKNLLSVLILTALFIDILKGGKTEKFTILWFRGFYVGL